MKFNAHISKMASFGVHINLRRRIVQYENTHTHTYYLKKMYHKRVTYPFYFILSFEPILKLALKYIKILYLKKNRYNVI